MALPPLPMGTIWPPNVHCAHQIMEDISRRAFDVLSKEADAIRLKLHAENLGSVVPILLKLEGIAQKDSQLLDWIHNCTEYIGMLVAQLNHTQETLASWWVAFFQFMFARYT